MIRIQNVSTSDSTFLYWDQPFDHRFLIHEGDMLLTLSGSFRTTIWDGPKALLNQRIVKIAPLSQLDSRYLLHFLSRKLGDIERMGRHALVNNVSLTDLKAMPIPLPPLEEQRRIAAILDQAEELRAKRRAAIALLDQLPQAIFLEMFGDPLSPATNMPLTRFEDVVRLKRGYDLPVQNRQAGDIPVYGANGPLGTHDNYMVSFATVITGRSGTLGEVHVSSGPSWPLNTTLYAYDLRGNSLCYIAQLLKQFRLGRFTRGVGVPTLNRNLLADEAINLPSLVRQQEFAVKVAAIHRSKAAHHFALAEIDTLFTSLQSHFFPQTMKQTPYA